MTLGVGLPLVVGILSGTLDVPRNDDWSYRGPALLLYLTGRLEIDGAAQALLIAQILATQPLLWIAGGSPWAFLAAGILFDLAALIAVYLLARQVLDRRLATLVAALVPLFPGYLPYAVSYMTDVPAAAAQWAALAAGAAALRHRPVDGRWLAISLVLGCLGFGVREFAVAAPIAVLVAVLLAEPRRARHWLAGGLVVAVLVGIRWWRTQLPGSPGAFPPVPGVAGQLVPAITTVAFVLAPVSLVAALRRRRAWRWRDVAIGAGIAIVLLAARGKLDLGDVLLDNLISAYGVPARDYLIGGRPRLLTLPIWSVIGAAGIAALILLGAVCGGTLGALLRRVRATPSSIAQRLGSPEGSLLLFVAGLGVGLLAFGTYRWLFDRYLWPLVPPLAILLLHGPPAERSPARAGSRVPEDGRRVAAARAREPVAGGLALASALSLAGLLAMSGVLLLNADAFDAARWRAGEALVARGYAAETVDAGPEWVGSHPTGRAVADRPLEGPIWWQGWWPDFRMCAFVTSTPQQDPRYRWLETRDDAYRMLLLTGARKPLYLYAVDDPACPPAPARAAALLAPAPRIHRP